MEIITSVNNEKVKHAASLAEKKYRRNAGTYLVEGYKLVNEVVCGAAELVHLYVNADYAEKYQDLISKCLPNVSLLKGGAYEKISSTVTSQGIIAEVKMRPSISFLPEEPFLVLDRIQDPGNLGTIIRTAAAVGYHDVILLDCVDAYNPKTVRSSSGGIFYVNLFPLSKDELFETLSRFNAKLYSADMNGENIFKAKLEAELYGLVIGSEGAGVDKDLRAASARVFSLPMESQMESLNAAVSGSVIMYQLKNGCK